MEEVLNLTQLLWQLKHVGKVSVVRVVEDGVDAFTARSTGSEVSLTQRLGLVCGRIERLVDILNVIRHCVDECPSHCAPATLLNLEEIVRVAVSKFRGLR